MIGYALLAGGSAAALATTTLQLAPAAVRRFAPGKGLHRYAMSPAQLRRENAQLICALTTISSDRDNAVRSAQSWEEAATLAASRIDELTEQVRELPQLRDTVTALRAELANTHPIRPLLADRAAEDTLPHGIAVVAGTAFATTDPGHVRA